MLVNKNFCPLSRRFPRFIFSPFCNYPFVVRLGYLAEYLVSKQRRKKSPGRNRASYRLLSMTGRKHLLLLRESLYSFLQISSRLPALEVLNDGSLQNEEIIQALSFWPELPMIFQPDQIISELQDHPAFPLLRTLVDSHILGLKLAFILCRSKNGNQFFVDSDILWFRDPAEHLEGLNLDYPIAIGREDAVSVNKSLASSFCPSLLELPGPNSGCVWSTINLLESEYLHQVLEESIECPDEVYNEQTILAILTRFYGRWLPEYICDTSFSDRFAIARPRPSSRPYCSRHYVSILRHLFYLDVITSSGGWVEMIKTMPFPGV